MLAFVRAWPACACITAMMLAHASCVRSEVTPPAETARLMDFARLAREARLAETTRVGSSTDSECCNLRPSIRIC